MARTRSLPPHASLVGEDRWMDLGLLITVQTHFPLTTTHKNN
jgi:hypothetical protein